MKILDEPIGKQDQYLAAFGGLINLEINKNGKVMVSPLNTPFEVLKNLEDNLLLFHTQIKHSAKDIIQEQKESIESDQEKMNQMKVIKDIGAEIKESLEKGDLQKFGKWMNVHW